MHELLAGVELAFVVLSQPLVLLQSGETAPDPPSVME